MSASSGVLDLFVKADELQWRLNQGDFAGALCLSESLLNLAPCAETRIIVAAISIAAGRPDAGLSALASETSSTAIALRGKCHIARGEYAEARRLTREALDCDPNSEDLRFVLLDATSRLNAAGADVNLLDVISSSPGYSLDENIQMHAIANSFLRRGIFRDGYAAILELADGFPPSRMGARSIEIFGGHLPRWDGGKVGRLLVVANEGTGDILQFVRFCAQARRQADHLILCAPGNLLTLLARCDGVDAVVAHDEIYSAAQIADAYIPTMYYLPHALGAEYGPSSYLAANAAEIPALPIGRNVGLCWTCSSLGAEIRGIPEPLLDPLGEVAGIAFHSLVPGAGARWMRRHYFADYDATAALVAALDLVITCDTSIAHLAGGMGKAVWVLLPADADWRWGTDEHRSRWYPTARLFRQPSPGDWGSVIGGVLDSLSMPCSDAPLE